MIFYINKLKKIVVGRNNQTATQIINIDFQTIGEISFSFIDDRNKILPIEAGQYYFAGKKDTLLFFTEDFKIENNVLTFKVDTYTEPFLNTITKRNTEIEVEIGFKNEAAKNVCLRDYAFAQPRVYIDGLPPGNVALSEYYTKKEIDALFSEVGVDLSDYTGENVSIKVNNEFITESNKNLFLRAYPADKESDKSCFIDMYGENMDGNGHMSIQSRNIYVRGNFITFAGWNEEEFVPSELDFSRI